MEHRIPNTYQAGNAQRNTGPWRRQNMFLVLVVALLSILLWQIPLFAWPLYPFRLFMTFVHEISHGLAAIITGGAFQRFVVRPDLTGTAWSAGGIGSIVTSAGYIGSAAIGGLLMILAARGIAAKTVLSGLGLILGLLCLLFVRNLFGIATGLVLATVLVVAGRRLTRPLADGLLAVLTVQLMLNALESLFDLLRISTGGIPIETDAQIMAQATGVPAIVWAVVWSAIALIILWFSLRIAYRRPRRPNIPS